MSEEYTLKLKSQQTGFFLPILSKALKLNN